MPSESSLNTSQGALPSAVPTIAAPHDEVELFRSFVELVRILRVECPWDRKQTHTTLMPLLLEEVYETIDAAEAHNAPELAKELGDIMLHVVMNAVIAEETEAFSMKEILQREFDKLVTRHPHVFGDVSADSADDVKRNWEQIKMREGRKSVVEGVPKHLPALLRATRIQEKVAAVGFDWDNAEGALAKVAEEFNELRVAREANNQADIEEEFGDALFALVNASRFIGVNAEQSLQKANEKFMRRFKRIEELAAETATTLDSMSLAEMDALWNRAKAEEKKHLPS
ncbi:MAG: nucleoside triphosphate pyrophosphohydrolase [Candidatus Kapabacteria bacterium]|jgi:MazG family protein|nr:nucleoside triphosphate pyrophosphohydrolase [Candidatus Kapabacteria bacterium]